MVGGGVNQRGKIDAPPQSIARLKCVWLLLILLDKVAFKFQTFKTFLSGRFEFDGGWGGVGGGVQSHFYVKPYFSWG